MVVSGGVRTAAVLFTDLADSTAMRSRLGEERAERLRVAHDSVVRGAIEGAGGTVVKTMGDGTMATFLSAAEAIAAAVAVQQGIDRHNRRSGAERLGVRVGVSAGDVSFDGVDCHGLPVIEAQRLESAARPGQILCADLVVSLARGRGEHVFDLVGRLDLKGLGPVSASSVMWEPAAWSAEADLPTVLRQAPALPFSGRAAEVEVLAGAWARCRSGGSSVVLVAGEPGIGKTRLVTEAVADARADGAEVLAGRCDEDVRVPFGPFVGALRWMVEHAADHELPERLGTHPGELVALVPELVERVPGMSPPPRADADTERLRLFQAVCSWLGAGGPNTPTVIVLDDLHWADTGTVLLLRHLVNAAPAGLLILGTYRDTDLSRMHPLGAALADLRQAAHVRRVKLGGLDKVGVRELVEAAGGHELEPSGVAFADLMCDETAGNPLFVGQVLQHLAEGGDLVFRAGRWSSERDLTSIGIPEGVREVIGRRLSRLPPGTEGVLRTAAIIGLEFDLHILSKVADRTDEDVLGLLEQAVTAALVTEVGVDRFRFAHALVRETLHSELTASRRAREHRRVAEVIERRHGDDLDQVAAVLARHWGEACAGGDTTVAVEWATRAGEADLARRAPEEAASWFERALDLLDHHHAAGGVRRHLVSRLAHAQSRALVREAGATANLAARLALDEGDVEAAAAALCLTVRQHFGPGQPPDVEKIALLERTLELVGDGQPDLRGRLLASLASELVFIEDFDRREPIIDELRQLIDNVHDPVQRWQLMRGGTVGASRRWSRRPAMEAIVRSCREVAPLLHDSFEQVDVEEVLWEVSANLGDRDLCDRAISTITRETADDPLRRDLAYLGINACLDGRLDDFERIIDQRVDVLRSAHHPDAFLYWYVNTLPLMRERGTVAALEALIAGWRDFPTPPRSFAAAPLYAAFVRLLAGDRGVSLDGFDLELLPDDSGRSGALAATAEVAAATGQDRLVRDVLPLVAGFEGMHLAGRAVYLGPYDRLAALLRDRLGDHRAADEAFARAVRACQAFRAPAWVARTELDWAESLARRLQPGAAAAHVQAARTAIGELPLTESRNRADQLEARVVRT